MDSTQLKPKTAHVNLMVDTVIANLPEDGLRSVMRSLLTTDPSITSKFEAHVREYLHNKADQPIITDLFIVDDKPLNINSRDPRKGEHNQTDPSQNDQERWGSSYDTVKCKPGPELYRLQQYIRCSIGCGMCYQSIPFARRIVDGVSSSIGPSVSRNVDLVHCLESFDGDMLQMVTAIQKTLLGPSGKRELDGTEKVLVQGLLDALQRCKIALEQGFPFERSLGAVSVALGQRDTGFGSGLDEVRSGKDASSDTSKGVMLSETFELNGIVLPRLFSGLWQLSSPAWGTAPFDAMNTHFTHYISKGLLAWDMADHYADSELIFGRLRNAHAKRQSIFGATKYCVFNHPVTITAEVISAAITERCTRLDTRTLDLLQFHWQSYADPQYISVLQFLHANSRVAMLGLCNFDTLHLEQVLSHNIPIATNQVQFSLIDARPELKMGAVCAKYNIKLLTYGTLCGGFLADKWLDRSEPEAFSQGMTPSQRKYLEMIKTWGDWALFQRLLRELKNIAMKRGVSVANVATRWVLDHAYVGAVIVGARLGVSEHVEDNLASCGWELDADDRGRIESVLELSRRRDMLEIMGDCGAEYR
ncbi:Aldo/keto reductase [Pseudovirgaria hyperparasitica]|uniref:Aldo/keto reductase n=1 Tax=Pseudovirgaria hyperparasitica TaxID=470096 RepID=A0A6A6VXD3_9PEZI|nr:Aldo/keto reductase [Pseudovirgaria hyperparasitica]KAF2754466.1 Aldo/keto reductase [Pseudovirgaria hyperparasitica]